MAVNPLSSLRGGIPSSAPTPVTGRVTKVDADGAWVVPLGGDQRSPVGPCRGPGLEVGQVVLVVWTQERPWAIHE